MWSRALLFAEPAVDAAPPMWHRPAQPGSQLISLDPVVTATPMWNRPLTRRDDAVPIFEEAVVSPSHMWHRAPTGMPMCPCCTSPTPAGLAMAERAEALSRPGSPPRSPISFRPSTTATTATSAPRRSSESAFSVSTTGSQRRVRLQHQASSFSLRIKRSFARLRGRSSVESM